MTLPPMVASPPVAVPTGELRALVEVERDGELWGNAYRITPRLVEEPIGDGKQLIWFETMDSRPDFWVLRVDSLWDLDNIDSDQLEEIFEAIEGAYGTCVCEEEEATPAEIAACVFPVYHNGTGGCRWGAYEPRREPFDRTPDLPTALVPEACPSRHDGHVDPLPAHPRPPISLRPYREIIGDIPEVRKAVQG